VFFSRFDIENRCLSKVPYQVGVQVGREYGKPAREILQVDIEVAGIVLQFRHLVNGADVPAKGRSFPDAVHAYDIFYEERGKASDPEVVEECPGENRACGGKFVDGDSVEHTLIGLYAGFGAPFIGG